MEHLLAIPISFGCTQMTILWGFRYQVILISAPEGKLAKNFYLLRESLTWAIPFARSACLNLGCGGVQLSFKAERQLGDWRISDSQGSLCVSAVFTGPLITNVVQSADAVQTVKPQKGQTGGDKKQWAAHCIFIFIFIQIMKYCKRVKLEVTRNSELYTAVKSFCSNDDMQRTSDKIQQCACSNATWG